MGYIPNMLGSSFVHSPMPDLQNYYSFSHAGVNPVTFSTKGDMPCQILPNRTEKIPASIFVGQESNFSESIQWHMPQPKTLDREKHDPNDVDKQNQCITKALSVEKSGISGSHPFKRATQSHASAGNNEPLNLCLNANVDIKLSCLPKDVENATDLDQGGGGDQLQSIKIRPVQ